jgi:hypothetical protein
MLIEETQPETPALIIPPGRDAAAPTWRAWVGYRHLVFEQAEGATRDQAIRALLGLMIERSALVMGETQLVRCEQRALMRECLLVRIEALGEGWTYKIVEAC